MQTPQRSGIQLAQSNLDAAVTMGAHATRFWRRCATLQAQGANEMLEEGLRITRVILKTQAEMIEAAGQLLSEGQRVATENIEQASEPAGGSGRESGNGGDIQPLKPAQRAGQHAGSQAHRRAS
jgi:hypothetical protein